MIRSECLYTRKYVIAALNARGNVLLRVILCFGLLLILEIIAFKAFDMMLDSAKQLIHSSPLIVIILFAYVVYGVAFITIIIIRSFAMYYSMLSDKSKLFVRCEFGDEKFVCALVNNKEKMTMTYSYEAIKSAFEKKGFFILETNEKTIAVACSDITEGGPAELRSLLTEKLGNRFSVR